MEGLFCFIMNVLVAIIVTIIVVRLMHTAEHDRRTTKDLYQQKLAALKHDPTNAILYEETLAVGRERVRLSRKVSGVADFDEVLLNQELNAVRPNVSALDGSGTSASDRLRQLGRLQQNGLISDAEYQSKWQKLLDEL